MFLNILRISVVTIGCVVVIFHSYKPTGSTNQPEVQTIRKYKPAGSTNQPELSTIRFVELVATLAGQGARGYIVIKKDFKLTCTCTTLKAMLH